jgi:hypothetical protein
MKVKCSFIYETKKVENYKQAKAFDPKKRSRKQFENDFAKYLQEQVLNSFFEDNSISDVKAKIIERKDGANEG